jgi:hypothetical protein
LVTRNSGLSRSSRGSRSSDVESRSRSRPATHASSAWRNVALRWPGRRSQQERHQAGFDTIYPSYAIVRELRRGAERHSVVARLIPSRNFRDPRSRYRRKS